jgi:two-component system sensor histidine kinase KdpD
MLSGLRWGARTGFATALPAVIYYLVIATSHRTNWGAGWATGLAEIIVVFSITAILAGRSRQLTIETRERAQLQATLRKLSHDLAGTSGMVNVGETVVRMLDVRHGYSSAVAIFADRIFSVVASKGDFELSEQDKEVIESHLEEHLKQGIVLSLEDRFVYPLLSAGNLLGLLIVRASTLSPSTVSDRHGMLKAMAMTVATAVQREILAQQSLEADLHRQHEDLYGALLSSISHDFRTPLASITGAAETLAMPQAILSEGARQDMVAMIREEADRLNRFVANLLDMTKLESGALELNREQIEVGDLVGTALMRSRRRMEGYAVDVDIPPDLPMINVDFVLMEHVLTNLLENGVKYSERGTRVKVEAARLSENIAIRVIDQGKGIPTEDLDRVFEKFYRVQRGDKVSAGTGLGLSICQGIVVAHHGNIRAFSPVSQSGGGTMIEIQLPIEKSDSARIAHEQEIEGTGFAGGASLQHQPPNRRT